MSKWIVVTSIHPPSGCIKELADLKAGGWSILVVGDARSPRDWHCDGVEFLSLQDQDRIFGALADTIPRDHYARKNLGYLYALDHGARLILETDDDNIPYGTFGERIERRVRGRLLRGPGWVNVYRHFADRTIWPRGLPLDAIHVAGSLGAQVVADCPVQQFLVDEDPDVDAIYRLIFKDPVSFDPRARPIIIDPGTWAPFNSQNTLFFDDAFCLAYLPCYATFRMTDIWRSFVAQAVLAYHKKHFAFHPSTVRQVRNAHDLSKDFEAENVGYLHNRPLMDALNEGIAAHSSPHSTLAGTAWHAWRALVRARYLPDKELAILESWLLHLEDTSAERLRFSARSAPRARSSNTRPRGSPCNSSGSF